MLITIMLNFRHSSLGPFFVLVVYVWVLSVLWVLPRDQKHAWSSVNWRFQIGCESEWLLMMTDIK